MLARAAKWLAACLVVVAPLSCRSLPQARIQDGEGTLAWDTLPSANEVPLEWGELKAVTEAPGGTNVSLLWFQDDSGAVRVVGLEHVRNNLWTEARLVRRR
jgi:hypothetical protein